MPSTCGARIDERSERPPATNLAPCRAFSRDVRHDDDRRRVADRRRRVLALPRPARARGWPAVLLHPDDDIARARDGPLPDVAALQSRGDAAVFHPGPVHYRNVRRRHQDAVAHARPEISLRYRRRRADRRARAIDRRRLARPAAGSSSANGSRHRARDVGAILVPCPAGPRRTAAGELRAAPRRGRGRVSQLTVILLLVFGFLGGWPGWIFWAFLILLLIGVRHPPPVDSETPLDPKRKLLGWLMLATFVVTFTPNPFPIQDAIIHEERPQQPEGREGLQRTKRKEDRDERATKLASILSDDHARRGRALHL